MLYFLLYIMLSTINLQILNLKIHLHMEKQKRHIALRRELNQMTYSSLEVSGTKKYFRKSYLW
jgi:hypothetical protein